MRALLVGMEKWVKTGAPPPASQYPRVADGTLVAVNRLAFPAIPGVHSPAGVAAARVNGKTLPLLVPQVGPDGNELAGVRTPEIVVPTATYTGWNFRGSAIGGTDQLVSLTGSAIPFARTAAERKATRDPRPSLEERYQSSDAFLAQVRAAADRLVKDGYLLADDVAQHMKRAQQHWGMNGSR